MRGTSGRRGKLVGDGGIDVGVVAGIGSKGAGAKQQWQKLRIGYGLPLGSVNLAGQLENFLAGEFGILPGEDLCQAVVFTHKEGVHRRQPHLFNGTDVAGQEEIGPLVATLVAKSQGEVPGY